MGSHLLMGPLEQSYNQIEFAGISLEIQPFTEIQKVGFPKSKWTPRNEVEGARLDSPRGRG